MSGERGEAQTEARDFSRWIQITDKPAHSGGAAMASPNPVTGKSKPGRKYAPTTRGHSESVLRGFYDFHRDAGSGPMVNPFPLVRPGGRAHAHHNPMDPFRKERTGLYRPRIVQRVPRSIPDERFNDLFAQLGSHRDRALVAFWVSSGARASELLGARYADADAGQQLITVVRKGTRATQQLPASPDAFVWLRLYQAQLHGLVPTGRDDPLWWTLRRPFRQLSYHAAYRMFQRANAALGTNWSLHDLRHTAAYRMARDPDIPLTDVQWVLGHAHLSTTEIYLTPVPPEVIAGVLAHFTRRSQETASPRQPDPGSYRPETLNILFGEGTA
ncbi:tyrosine-type recombinase/integrase [Nonomuraea sp. NPDC003707]